MGNIIKKAANEELKNIKSILILNYDKLWNKKNEKYDRKNYEKFNYVKDNKIELLTKRQELVGTRMGIPKKTK